MQQDLTILFADIANSTMLYQEKGDISAHKLISDCLSNVREIVESQHGKLLRTVGDAVLASFERVDDACEAAMNIHRFHVLSPLTLRVGYHHGEVIPDAGDVYGNAVNLAARVASFANAEEIFTTQSTVEKMSKPYREKAAYLDLIDFKGISEPMPVWRVNWAEEAAETQIFPVANRTELFSSTYSLEVVAQGKRIRLDSAHPKLTIGRAAENGIVMEHDSTSRTHAVIEHIKGKFVLKDISTNGTYVIREHADPVYLRRGELVLDQRGKIGAGWNPSEPGSPSITYQLTALK